MLSSQLKVLKRLNTIAAALRLPASSIKQVSAYLEQFTDGKYGHGRWMELVVASCVYIVCRENKRPLTLIDVAVSENPLAASFASSCFVAH